ncbi:anosmin-1a [Synchiropus picturatus]
MMSHLLFSVGIIFLLRFSKTFGKRDDPAEDEPWSEDISRARCTSRCLSLYVVDAHSTSPQNNGSLGWCHHHKQCAKCLEPCDSSNLKKKKNCNTFCGRAFPKQPWECVTSCEFLQSVALVKQGTCPPPDEASGFAAACVESCDRDQECPAQKKCCSNGCGHTCQAPKDVNRGVPLKPRKELTFVETLTGNLEVHWASRFNISAEPVVYVLQRRWNFGIQPSEDTATDWEVVTKTTEPEARMSDFRAGRWYQFRVAAVNAHGTRGFTTPSRHIHSRRDPARPLAPAQLRVVNMTFGPGRSVRASLKWNMPSNLDVPVHHYKLTWMWTSVEQTSASSVTKRRKTVRECQVELDSMRANRSYTVEVQAVSYWGGTQLKGPRATLQFTTQHTMSSAPNRKLAVPAGEVVDVGTPFYQDGLLRVHVYWQRSTDPSVEVYKVQWGPEFCSHNVTRPMEKTVTQESFISLEGLLFSCKYKVLLLPVSKKSRPLAESVTFYTPTCAAVQAKSPSPVNCLGETVRVVKVLPKAANLTAFFSVHSGNVTAIFKWSTPSLQQVMGYQVTWAEITSTARLSSDQLPQVLISQTQIVPPDRDHVVVSGLHPASLYRLEVQTITAEGEGPVSSRTFQTPGYQSIRRHRTKGRDPQHKQPIILRH